MPRTSDPSEQGVETMNDRTFELIQKHLEGGGVYNFASSHDSAPTRDALLAFGQEVECAFPEEFIVHSTGKYGGLYVQVNEKLWPRAKEFDFGPFWTFLYGLYTLNVADGIPDFMDLRANTATFREETGLALVPCLKIIGDANRYCFDSAGRLGEWDHETNEVEYDGRSFFEVLDNELAALQERKEKKCGNTEPRG